jgi:hypothetical protein
VVVEVEMVRLLLKMAVEQELVDTLHQPQL